MIRLLFDGTAMQGTILAKAHGGSEYAKFLYKVMVTQGREFDVVLYSNRTLDESTSSILQTEHKGNVIYVNSKEELYDLINQNGYDRFFSALPYDYDDYNCKSEMVGVIHGLRTIELPWDEYKYSYYTKWYKRMVARILGKSQLFVEYWRQKHINKMQRLLEVDNSRFITVSNHSKYSILNFFPNINDNSIDVFYSPFDAIEPVADSNESQYFLMVSSNRYEKNVLRAVESFDKLFSDGKLQKFKVILTGAKKLRCYGKIKNKKHFELLDYVTYTELKRLFQHAFAFVYPSLNEGFGYPPLQAMSAGVPVIASSATSIPEVCGDAACYFSPKSKEDLMSRILWIVNDRKYRETLIYNGHKRVAKLLEKQEKEIPEVIDKIFK